MTEFLIGIIIMAAIISWRVMKKDKDIKDIDKHHQSSKQLVIKTLKDMECKSEIEDDVISFTYQGESFHINADDEHRFIIIWNTWSEHMSLDDEDIDSLKEAINITNTNRLTTVLYSVDKEANRWGIHYKLNILFIPQIPDIKGYFEAMLDEIFIEKREIHRQFDTVKIDSTNSNKKKRVKVKGFV